MKVSQLGPVFEDERGVITDIVQHTPFDSVTIISCVKGSIRGNHYHKESVQFTYVMSGEMRALSQMPGEAVESKDLTEGHLLESPALERHALHALEDSLLLVITRGPRGGKNYEDDTYRVEPLQVATDN
jgi:quercetin dioxygenase-like cupin family protein